jgi:hypothetical protein
MVLSAGAGCATHRAQLDKHYKKEHATRAVASPRRTFSTVPHPVITTSSNVTVMRRYVSHFCHVTILPCHDTFMSRFHRVALVPCPGFAVSRLCGVTILPYHTSTVSHVCGVTLLVSRSCGITCPSVDARQCAHAGVAIGTRTVIRAMRRYRD